MHAYKIQVNPRDLNLFYLKDDLRERIVKKESFFGFKHHISMGFNGIVGSGITSRTFFSKCDHAPIVSRNDFAEPLLYWWGR